MSSHAERIRTERRALRVSIWGSFSFVVISFVFALTTSSDAIFFDGIYSMIGLMAAMLTLKVARLAELPDDDRFHFGYTSIEPTINLFKALIISVSCVLAGVQAVERLWAGGTSADYGLAVVYGGIATVACMLFAWGMQRSSIESRSELVHVEARTWLLDGVLSASVLFGFIGAWILERSTVPEYAPLVDPIILIVLVAAALPVPVQIMMDSLREVVAMAPPEAVVDEIERRLKATLADVPHDQIELRVSKQGRNTYLLVHVVVPNDFPAPEIEDLDQIRFQTEKALQAWNPEIVMDMLFVADPELTE